VLTDSERAAAATPAKAPRKKATLTLVLVPDGEQTWFALDRDQKAATERLAGARAGRDPKLNDAPELATLREPAFGGGFYTLQSLVEFVLSARSRAADARAVLSHAPHGGQSFWPSQFKYTPAANGGHVSTTLRVPAGAFEDVGGLLPWLTRGH
jgi:hypothetical protein